MSPWIALARVAKVHIHIWLTLHSQTYLFTSYQAPYLPYVAENLCLMSSWENPLEIWATKVLLIINQYSSVYSHK